MNSKENSKENACHTRAFPCSSTLYLGVYTTLHIGAKRKESGSLLINTRTQATLALGAREHLVVGREPYSRSDCTLDAALRSP